MIANPVAARTRRGAGCLLALLIAAAANAAPADPVGFVGGDELFVNFEAPSDATGPFEEIAWTRGDAGSSFAAWENFAFANNTANAPALPPQGPIGVPDTALPILPTNGSAAITYVPDSSGAILTTTENLYTIGSEGTFELSASGAGLGVGYDTRIVLQVGALGNDVPADGFRLDYTDAGGQAAAAFPVFNALDRRILLPEESPFGGDVQEFAVVWSIPRFSLADYTLSFDASTNTSLSFVTLDALAATAVAPVPGDFSGDGVVDAGFDYLAWATQYGSPGPNADQNGDGLVDAADFTLLRQQLAAAPAMSVPEPSAAGYGLMAAATAAFCWGTHAFTAPRSREDDA